MSRTWNRHTFLFAAVTLAASLCAGGDRSRCGAGGGPPRRPDVPPRKVICTQRLRLPADLFKDDPVSFKRARVDASGTIRAVPLAGAGLPGLIFASGGLLGWWGRRKKSQMPTLFCADAASA